SGVAHPAGERCRAIDFRPADERAIMHGTKVFEIEAVPRHQVPGAVGYEAKWPSGDELFRPLAEKKRQRKERLGLVESRRAPGRVKEENEPVTLHTRVDPLPRERRRGRPVRQAGTPSVRPVLPAVVRTVDVLADDAAAAEVRPEVRAPRVHDRESPG